MTVQTVSLSPAEGCLARQISYWIGISAEGKGGSTDNLGRGWTYLSAEDLQGRVLDYDHIELSIPTIYRALRSLVTKGWFLREKLTSHRWYQVFHYTFGPNHPSQTLKNGTNQSDRIEPVTTDGSQLSNPSQSSTSKNHKQVDVRREEQSNSRGSLRSQTASAPPINREESQFVPAPQVTATERVGFKPTVAQPLTSIKDAAPPDLLQELQTIEANYRSQLQSLKEPEPSPLAVKEPPSVPQPRASFSPPPQQLSQAGRKTPTPGEKIRALAAQFCASRVVPVSPSQVITKNGQRFRIDDGATAPLR